ncbi:MAG TPA: hypothetical protein VNT42_12990 [Sphingomonas sp.]|nr:hypothetical protein [Sphingomonas sp.]
MQLWVRRNSGRTWVALVIMLVASLMLMLPGLVSQHALSGDSHIHIRWQAQYGTLVWASTPYPRWLPDMNASFGSPAFFFYPPLLQWVGALFAPLLPGPGHAMIRTAFALWLLSAAGGLGTWLWLRALGASAGAAMVGALIYLVFPYRAYFDIYQRGALPELAGISVMPWLLCMAQRLKNGSPAAWGAYALSVGVILYSHLPAAEMGLLFASCYILILADRNDWFRFLLRAGTATIAGFMIGALCIAPALSLLRFIPKPGNMWGNRNQPMHWLLFSHEKWLDPGVHIVVVALCLLSVAMMIVFAPLTLRAEPSRPRLKIAWFLMASIAVVLLLNSAPSRAFWELQTPLSRIQFPFRLLSLTILAFAGLGGLAFDRLSGTSGRMAAIGRLVVAASVPGLLLVDIALFGVHVWHSRDHLPPDNREILERTTDTGEYVIGELRVVGPRFRNARYSTTQGDVHAVPTGWDSRFLSFETSALAPGRIAIRQFAFTGWTCRIDGGPWQPPITDPYPVNLPLCDIPAGRHRLDVSLPATIAERAGGIATLLGLLLAFGNILLSRFRSTARNEAPRRT